MKNIKDFDSYVNDDEVNESQQEDTNLDKVLEPYIKKLHTIDLYNTSVMLKLFKEIYEMGYEDGVEIGFKSGQDNM